MLKGMTLRVSIKTATDLRSLQICYLVT